MKKETNSADDTLRPEYDLKGLRIRRVGAGRKQFKGLLVSLEPDVAAVFPDTESVNKALRRLMEITEEQTMVPT